MRNRIRSEIGHRLRVFSWLHPAGRPFRVPQGREDAPDRRMSWLGPDLLFDPRTGRIQAL